MLGNHDFESNQQDEIRKILSDAGVVMLDGDTTEIHGIGFAGIKGFAGGFGRRALGPWGEDIIKQFVHEAVDEALKLESALARLRNDHLIAVLHYAPIQATVEGEPLEIYPVPRLQPARGAAHPLPGHRGLSRPRAPRAAGRTHADEVPVYNVSMSLMRETVPGRGRSASGIEMKPSDHSRPNGATGARPPRRRARSRIACDPAVS